MELRARVPAADDQISSTSRSAILSSWYDDYGTMILRTCYLYLGNRTDAQDALQDTFLKAWRHMDHFKAPSFSSTKSWLLRIAVNTCRDMLRMPWHRRIDHSCRIEELPELQVTNGDRDLLLDVMSLPAKYKEVILLYYYHGMTTKESACVLKTSESTVSRRLASACRILGEALEVTQ